MIKLNNKELILILLWLGLLVGVMYLPIGKQQTQITTTYLNNEKDGWGDKYKNTVRHKKKYVLNHSEFTSSNLTADIFEIRNNVEYPSTTLLGTEINARRNTYTKLNLDKQQNQSNTVNFIFSNQQIVSLKNNILEQKSTLNQPNYSINRFATLQDEKFSNLISTKNRTKSLNSQLQGVTSLSTDLSSTLPQLISTGSTSQNTIIDPGDEPTGNPVPIGDGFILLFGMMVGYIIIKIKYIN